MQCEPAVQLLPLTHPASAFLTYSRQLSAVNHPVVKPGSHDVSRRAPANPAAPVSYVLGKTKLGRIDPLGWDVRLSKRVVPRTRHWEILTAGANVAVLHWWCAGRFCCKRQAFATPGLALLTCSAGSNT